MNEVIKSGLDKLLQIGPISINVGIVDFAEALKEQKAEFIHVDWEPPAGGDDEMADLLSSLL